LTIHAGFAIISDVRVGPGENDRTVYSAAGEGERDSDVLKKLRDFADFESERGKNGPPTNIESRRVLSTDIHFQREK
jgi:hypothetical protein